MRQVILVPRGILLKINGYKITTRFDIFVDDLEIVLKVGVGVVGLFTNGDDIELQESVNFIIALFNILELNFGVLKGFLVERRTISTTLDIADIEFLGGKSGAKSEE